MKLRIRIEGTVENSLSWKEFVKRYSGYGDATLFADEVLAAGDCRIVVRNVDNNEEIEL